MRVGYNPNKDKELEKNNYNHQVIVPVHIPTQEGYFKGSFQILQYCLESLFKTSHSKTYFTIVNNGSCEEVIIYLNQLHQENKIHEIIHTTTIGKLNAILKGLTGNKFELITITDSDVLFLNDWQNATYEVFEAFPKTGVVCTTPSSKSFNYKTFNIFFEMMFSKKIIFTPVKNPKALENFALSIGNPNFYNAIHLKKYLTISNNEISAVIGAGHFVATYRGDVFLDLGIKASCYSLGGTSESDLLDLPTIKKGYWRLSTADNFTYHLGNVEEFWMNEKLEELRKEELVLDFMIHPALHKQSKFVFWFKNILLEKIMYKKSVKQCFLQYWGLTKEEARNY